MPELVHFGGGGSIEPVPAFFHTLSYLGYDGDGLMQICVGTSMATIVVISLHRAIGTTAGFGPLKSLPAVVEFLNTAKAGLCKLACLLSWRSTCFATSYPDQRVAVVIGLRVSFDGDQRW